MNLNQLIERTRDIVRDISAKPTNARQWKDTQILLALNSANDTLWASILQFDENWGLDTGTLTDLGITLSDFGGNLLVGAIPKDLGWIKAVDEDFTGDDAGRPLHKIDLHDRYRYNMGSRWDPPLRGWFQGTERTIFFTKQGRSPSPGTTRLWYHRAAPRLVRFEAVSKSSTVLQVEIDRSSLEDAGGLGVLIPRKNYYRNTFFECLDAGGERPETEEIGVASYDASADGHPFWDFAVSTHTVNQGSAVWGSVPLWPDLHHECLCVLAADVLLDGAGEAVGKAIIQGRVTKKLAEFVNTMEQRDLSGSRFVNLESR